MNKIEEILQSKETYDLEYPTISISDALEAIREFGKVCFEAARTNDYGRRANIEEFIDEPWVIDEVTGVCYGGHAKYLNYEEFLKEIEDENI